MNATIQDWIEKAEEDFRVMERESRVRKNPSFNAVCFHAQQCIEKLMKALLIEKRQIPPKTHDLLELNELLIQVQVNLPITRPELRELSMAAVFFRYPGDTADKAMARTSRKLCRLLRKAIVAEL